MKNLLFILSSLIIISLIGTPLAFAVDESYPILNMPSIEVDVSDFYNNNNVIITLIFNDISFVSEEEFYQSELYMSIHYLDPIENNDISVDMSNVDIISLENFIIDTEYNKHGKQNITLKITNIEEIILNKNTFNMNFILSSPEIQFDIAKDDEYSIFVTSNNNYVTITTYLLELNELRDIPKITVKKQNTIDALRQTLDSNKTMQYYMNWYNNENNSGLRKWFNKTMIETTMNHSERSEITIYELLGIPKDKVRECSAEEVMIYNRLTGEQFSSISPELIHMFTPEQICYLTTEKVLQLTPEQFSNLTPEQFSNLTVEQLDNLIAESKTMLKNNNQVITTIKNTTSVPMKMSLSIEEQIRLQAEQTVKYHAEVKQKIIDEKIEQKRLDEIKRQEAIKLDQQQRMEKISKNELLMDPEPTAEYTPEPVEKKCGAETKLVDGYCQIIKLDKEPVEQKGFFDWLMSLFGM